MYVGHQALSSFSMHTASNRKLGKGLEMRLSAVEGWAGVATKANTLHVELRHDPFLNANILDLLYCFQFLFPPLIFLLALLYVGWSYKSIGKYAKKAWEHG